MSEMVFSDDERLQTPKEFARQHDLSTGKVRRLIESGQLDYIMIGSRISYPIWRVATAHTEEQGEGMSRRNEGPRLRWLEKRNCYYITWTERGRSRERSTGT
jgi:hypothetical protein